MSITATILLFIDLLASTRRGRRMPPWPRSPRGSRLNAASAADPPRCFHPPAPARTCGQPEPGEPR
jgi:hypothetical protein